MRRLCVLFFVVFSVAMWLEANEEMGRPTLDALFGTHEMDLKQPSGLRWLPDGKTFLYLASEGAETILWKEDSLSGAKKRVVNWSDIMQELGARRPGYQAPELGDVNRSSWTAYAPVLSPDGALMAGVSSGDLYLVDLETGKARFLTFDEAEESFPSFAPDGGSLAFIRDGNLCVVDLQSGLVRALTSDGEPGRIFNGVADWLYQEELDLDRSFFFSPDGTQILFLRFDDSPVGVNPIATDAVPYATIEHQRYPTAGTTNPKVRLGLVDLATGKIRFFDTGREDQYLVRAGWTPDGRAWVQRLNRAQNLLELLVSDGELSTLHSLISQRDEKWINLSDDLRFLKDGRILWSSESSGWRHFELYSQEGKLIRQLDSGPWEVAGLIGLDPEEKTVFFRSNRENRRQYHLDAMDLEKGKIRRLDQSREGVHRGILSPTGRLLIDQWSSNALPPRADLLSAEGGAVRHLWDCDAQAKKWDLLPFETEIIRADDGTELDGLLLKPRDFDPTHRYPVVLYVYGGPHSQLTQDAWGGSIANTYRLFAEMGIATFLVDNRGTTGRGRDFERAVYRHLGDLEVKDQLAAARWLKSQPWVDGSRIAVYGGSYGGYMTLMCLLKAPDVFRAGIAYAPVTDWSLYDTAYTERYMGTPQNNPDGYRDSAPLNFATKLKGDLLLVHGGVDNNVHLQNSLQLMDRLAMANIPFEMMIYPQTRHGVRHSRFALHFHALKLDFLKRVLLDR